MSFAFQRASSQCQAKLSKLTSHPGYRARMIKEGGEKSRETMRSASLAPQHKELHTEGVKEKGGGMSA